MIFSMIKSEKYNQLRVEPVGFREYNPVLHPRKWETEFIRFSMLAHTAID